MKSYLRNTTVVVKRIRQGWEFIQVARHARAVHFAKKAIFAKQLPSHHSRLHHGWLATP